MASGEVVEDVFLCLGEGVGVGRDLHESVAANGECLTNDGEEWKWCGFGGKSAVHDDDCAGCGSGGEGFDAFAGYGIEDDACAFAAGDLLNTDDEVFFVGDDNVIGSES